MLRRSSSARGNGSPLWPDHRKHVVGEARVIPSTLKRLRPGGWNLRVGGGGPATYGQPQRERDRVPHLRQSDAPQLGLDGCPAARKGPRRPLSRVWSGRTAGTGFWMIARHRLRSIAAEWPSILGPRSARLIRARGQRATHGDCEGHASSAASYSQEGAIRAADDKMVGVTS